MGARGKDPCDEKFSCKMRFGQCESSDAGASVFLKKFIEQLARAHTLLAVAAQHVADGILHILRLQVLADLLDRAGQLLLALDADPRPVPRAGDRERYVDLAILRVAPDPAQPRLWCA